MILLGPWLPLGFTGVKQHNALRLWRWCLPCFSIFALSLFISLRASGGSLGSQSKAQGAKAHYSQLLTALPDLPPLPPNNNGKMCFLEIILKTERKGERMNGGQ